MEHVALAVKQGSEISDLRHHVFSAPALKVCLSACLPGCLSVCPSVRPSVRRSVHLSVCLSLESLSSFHESCQHSGCQNLVSFVIFPLQYQISCCDTAKVWCRAARWCTSGQGSEAPAPTLTTGGTAPWPMASAGPRSARTCRLLMCQETTSPCCARMRRIWPSLWTPFRLCCQPLVGILPSNGTRRYTT